MGLIARVGMLFIICTCAPIVAMSQREPDRPDKPDRPIVMGSRAAVRPPQPAHPVLVNIGDRAAAAVALLDRAPILNPAPANALAQDDFITLARITTEGLVLDNSISRQIFVTPDKIHSVEEAVSALEKVVFLYSMRSHAQTAVTPNPASTYPTANITSFPDKLVVRYRRTVDHRMNRGIWINTRTNAAESVAPAMYTFICSRENGKEEELTINCTKNCNVPFK